MIPNNTNHSAFRRPSGYVVGAYAMSPALRPWDPKVEESLYSALAADHRISALELPWPGRMHPHDEAWLIRNLPQRFEAVVTDIPHVMLSIANDSNYGLASSDDAGRSRALADTAKLRDDIRRLNDATGRSTVAVVELHSSPGQHGDADAFASSLARLASWDWDGAAVEIEHCDARVPGQQAVKGFLTLEDELRALHMVGVPFGVVINWGRSAIEFRDADRVVEHVLQAREAGGLSGVILSGAADCAGTLGAAWADTHNPIRQGPGHPFGDPVSLLTEGRIRRTLEAAGEQTWLGVKMAWPHPSGSIAERIEMIGATLGVCDASRDFSPESEPARRVALPEPL